MPALFQDTPKSLHPIQSPFTPPGRTLRRAGSARGEAETHKLRTGSDRPNRRLEHGRDEPDVPGQHQPPPPRAQGPPRGSPTAGPPPARAMPKLPGGHTDPAGFL